MIKASIWQTADATTLKESATTQVSECYTPERIFNLPNLSVGEIVKLEGYVTVYKSPLTLTVNANGDIEFYINDNQVAAATSNSVSIDVYECGVLPFECYIKVSSLPVNITLTPTNVYYTDGGFFRFQNPRNLLAKTTTITFTNPTEYVYQNYYIGDKQLKTNYVTYEEDGLKNTQTSVEIPPEL